MKLDMNSFNDILFGALKEQTPETKIKMLHLELDMAQAVLIEEMFNLMDELVEKNYQSEQFTKINNIKDNMEILIDQISELKTIIENNGGHNEQT